MNSEHVMKLAFFEKIEYFNSFVLVDSNFLNGRWRNRWFASVGALLKYTEYKKVNEYYCLP